MANSEQVLTIEPAGELRFKGPFTEVVTAELKLSNPSFRQVCFKVKTTAPKRYCVRPNSGIIESKSSVVVSVMLQPFDYDPTEKNKHKFMVQTMYAPDGKIESQENLWKDVKPDQLMDSKLKCVFEMPGQMHGSDTVTEEKVKPVQQEASFTQPKQESSVPTLAKRTPPPSPDMGSPKADMKRLQTQVAQLEKENSTLKQEELRLRKVAMSDTVSSTPTGVTQQLRQPEGYPLPYVYLIVALILGVIIGKLLL